MTTIMEQDQPYFAFAKQPTIVAQELKVNPDYGLHDKAIIERQSRHGLNQLRTRAKQKKIVILAHQFQGIIVWLLGLAAGLSFFFRDFAEGIAIIVVLIINAVIGFVSELRAARSMEALLSIARVTTRVLRGGKTVYVDAHELVPGDIVLLDAGDMVTADLRLIKASNLQSDESVLTGESVPVSKQIDAISKDAGVADRSCMAYKGTAITQGSGIGIVTATGMSTELGHISHLVETAETSTSPLERQLDRLGHRLVWLTLGLAALVIGAG
ncbi:MAG: cation-transporting P-type ATPase, partial [Proteobacteria bacterium]|nr:cation-transporting P-type ATPase [Pseudomonadota bacterium]